MTKSKKGNLIHVKFEYQDALESKKDILYLESNLLRIVKSIKHYHSSRLEELNAKLKLHRKIKELITKTSKLQKILPKIEIPKILRKKKSEGSFSEDEKVEEKLVKKTIRKQHDNSIESQLQDIQSKLNSLHR